MNDLRVNPRFCCDSPMKVLGGKLVQGFPMIVRLCKKCNSFTAGGPGATPIEVHVKDKGTSALRGIARFIPGNLKRR